jgi:hypothetical protein
VVAGPSARRAALALGLLTALWCAVGLAVPSTFGAHVAVDEPQYLLSATSLWEDLDLDISDELRDERWRDYHEATLPVQTKVLDGGRQVSPHDPLLPLVLAVPMGLGGWVAAKATLAALAGALAAVLVWTCIVRLGLDARRSVIGVACFSLTAPLSVYATQVYPELPGALVVACAVAALLGRRSWWAAACVCSLPWLSVKYVFVAGVLAAWVLWQSRSWRIVAFFGAMGAVFAGVHLAVYDGFTPYATGDHFTGGEHEVVGTNVNLGGRARRLLALLVDRDYGLAAWQPAWLLVLPGLVRNRRPWLTATFLAGWLTATFVALTMHGYWWPGRQTVVVLPVAVLLVVRWADVRLLAVGLAWGAVTWWWLIVEGLGDRVTWVSGFWTTRAWTHRLLRPLLVPANQDRMLIVWIAIVAAGTAAWWLLRRDEDASGGEGADADDPLAAHADRHRPVG